MGSNSLARLTRREREVVETILALSNHASAEDIRRNLSDKPSYSAVRALLARLEVKGCVQHVEDGARYIYSALPHVRRAARSALRQHLRVFWEGSPTRLIAALLREEHWSDEELEELRQAIKQAQTEKSDRRSS